MERCRRITMSNTWPSKLSAGIVFFVCQLIFECRRSLSRPMIFFFFFFFILCLLRQPSYLANKKYKSRFICNTILHYITLHDDEKWLGFARESKKVCLVWARWLSRDPRRGGKCKNFLPVGVFFFLDLEYYRYCASWKDTRPHRIYILAMIDEKPYTKYLLLILQFCRLTVVYANNAMVFVRASFRFSLFAFRFSLSVMTVALLLLATSFISAATAAGMRMDRNVWG